MLIVYKHGNICIAGLDHRAGYLIATELVSWWSRKDLRSTQSPWCQLEVFWMFQSKTITTCRTLHANAHEHPDKRLKAHTDRTRFGNATRIFTENSRRVQGCQFGFKRAKFLDFGFFWLRLATKNFIWLLSIFWLFLASFWINTEISNFSKIVCHPSVKVSYKLCYVWSHYPGFRMYVNIRSELVPSPRPYAVRHFASNGAISFPEPAILGKERETLGSSISRRNLIGRWNQCFHFGGNFLFEGNLN